MYKIKPKLHDFHWINHGGIVKIMFFSVLLLFIGAIVAPAKAVETQNLNVTLNVVNATMRSTIDKIEKAEGYVFIYNDDVRAELDKRVSLQMTNKNIDEVLDKMLAGTNISYKRSGKQITLYRNHAKPRQQPVPSVNTQAPQQSSNKHIVRGRIVDDRNEPIIGATVKINGKNTSGTITDIDGNYVLNNVAPNDVITFSYIGMRPQQIVVGGKNVINVTMQSDIKDLGDVVVVGYGTQRKESLTGSISMVTSKDLVATPQVSASNMLTGRIPGLITTQTYGIPGSDNATLSIRGFGNALFIVDGVERDARYIDPNTIESISILKDASSAIYGSRAGNGVVLITTKRGNQSKPTITVGTTLTLQSVTAMPKTVSAGQYAELKREEFYNANGVHTTQTPPFTEAQVQKYYDGTDPQYPNTNWYDQIIRNWAPMQQHKASIRGGNERFSYYSYFGYTKQESIFKTNFGNYQRYAFQTNLDAKVTNRIKLQLSIAEDIDDRNYPSTNVYSGTASLWGYFWQTLPTYPASLPNPDYHSYAGGGGTGGVHLVADRDITGYSRSKNYLTNISGTLTYDFKYVLGLSFKAFINYAKADYPTKIFHKPVSFYTYNYENDKYNLQGTYYNKASLDQTQGYSQVITSQFSLNYERLFANLHRVKAMALFESVDTKSDELSAGRTDFLTPSIDQMFMGSTMTARNNGSASENGRASYVGRLNYSYIDKYLLELILRADASAHFAPGHRWGCFPGVMVGWRIDQEKFMKNMKFDALKLRLSYGQMGNDAIGDFQYLSGYKLYEMTYLLGNTSTNGIKSTGLANPDMTWERMHIYNAGIDFSYNHRMLYGSFEMFYRKRSGILARRNISLPNTFGATLPLENLNSQDTRGWELELGTVGHFHDLNYDVKANFSGSRSKWIHYEEPDYTDPDQIRLSKNSGKWVDRTIGYISNGLFTSQEQIDNLTYSYPGGNGKLRPGDLIIVDRNNDGTIDWRDQAVIGKGTIPHYMMGLNFNLNYKGFDLSMLFQGAFGFYKKLIFSGGENYYSFVYDKRWTKDNNDPDALIPRLSGAPTNSYITQNNFVKSDYVRLKTLTIGYTVPERFLSKLGLQTLRLNVSAYNLLTISKLNKYNFDPEAPSGETGRSYPLNKTISFGLDVSF